MCLYKTLITIIHYIKKIVTGEVNAMELLEDFVRDPYVFIQDNEVETLVKLARYASKEFFNGVSIMEDKEYDLLIDAIQEQNPKHAFLKEVGAPTLTKDKVDLPFNMGSMNKFKPDNAQELGKWLGKHKGPYLISDKLDGVSAMLEIDKKNGTKLYSRGNGVIGTDISSLLKYLDISKVINGIKGDYVVIRGELIMKKDNFKKYENEMANARNMVSGIVNAKKVNKERIKDVDFVTYEVIEPWMPIEEQYIVMQKNGFNVVKYEKVNTIDTEILQTILRRRKQESDYEIDGIIISYNNPKKRVQSGNPEYAFAFKETVEDQTAEVEVLGVEWNESKDGYLKPRLNLVPTKLSGVTIRHVNAFSAKFIRDNKVGKGAVIKLVRSGEVIPHIMEVLKGAEAEMPDGEYVWTNSGVDVVREEKTQAGHIKQLVFFFQTLGIKHISESITKKLVQNGIDDLIKIVNVTKKDLEGIDGFQEKMVDKVYTNIKNKIDTMTLLEFMTASNVFGHGIGDKKLKKIIKTYPDIMDRKNVMDLVMDLEGFDTILATQFTTNLPEFIALFKRLPKQLQKRLKSETKKKKITDDENATFNGIKVVFSGFRNKDWEQTIENGGGEVAGTVSKNTSILVAKQDDIDKGTNSKIVKAQELGVDVMTPEAFADKYNL